MSLGKQTFVYHFYSYKTDLRVNYSWDCLILREFDDAEAMSSPPFIRTARSQLAIPK